jgi:polyvinyl alcohol dehydrogenase (cytochrome)
VAYVGISSKEKNLAFDASYECCTFRGAIVALDVRTGRMLWKTYMVPSNNGGGDINLTGFYSGNGIWGSSPVVDIRRGLLYVGTANNFSAPPGDCLTPEETGCNESGPDNHFDAIVALRALMPSLSQRTRWNRVLCDAVSSRAQSAFADEPRDVADALRISVPVRARSR